MTNIYDIRDFGAIGDGVFNCTDALQKAIDKCSADGGGTVLVSSGKYLFYPLRLKSDIRLEIAWDAVLLAGTDPQLYPEVQENPYWKVGYALRNNRRYVMYGEGISHVAICGQGKIDFQGLHFVHVDESLKPFHGHWKRKHDQLIPGRSLFFVGCKDVRLEDLTLVDTAGWFTWFLDCEDVLVRGVTMKADLRMPNSDGIHLGSCRNVVISDCNLTNGDDCIIVRSMQEQFDEPKPCENVTVTNCILQSSCLCIRFGWTHDYLMRNCTFSNLVIRESNVAIGVTSPRIKEIDQRDPPRYPDTPKPYPEVKPFAVENLLFTNIVSETRNYFFGITLTDNEAVDYVRDIAFRGVHAICGRYPMITALPEHHVSDIEFTDCVLEMKPSEHSSNQDGFKIDESMRLSYAENVTFNNFRIKKTF
ncbi:MAG: hypothetical protein IJJ26_00565 [Victivallales bacterium]|nr:hypothetical protein [Victivallales bacterium]